jgi:NAD(P)-dependent dehydrogenase (short-subunit alcohol dehydrogenase family)
MTLAAEFAGRVAVVTGGAGGVGASVSARLAAAGAHVAVWDAHSGAATSVAERISTKAAKAIGLGCDVADQASVTAALDQTRASLGTPSLLVTAAGITHVVPFLDISWDQWRRVLDVNLAGTFLCLQACARTMADEGLAGSVVCIASVAGRGPRPDAAAYAASKAGVISVVRSAAVALARSGITVNAVCPGVVDTDMTRTNARERARQEGITEQTALQRLLDRVPLGRIQTPTDVADVTLFLLSRAGSYVTGQALNACGGLEFD